MKMNFINLLKKIKEQMVSTEVETEPEIEVKPLKIPSKKPITPLKPIPGITPKPKALNKDIELFLRKRKNENLNKKNWEINW